MVINKGEHTVRREEQTNIPPIDRIVPATLQTATFGLG
jgi:hypothetical protein